jgi:predicted dehydrogenase
MLRGGLIGLGNVALHGHLPGWRRRLDVAFVGATDVRPARRAECAARLPGARWYDSSDELLADPSIDFVDICTPPASHATLIRDALRRGAHVLCEKPLVCSLEDVRLLAQLAAAGGRVLRTVDNWHHAPIIREVGRLLEHGEIGTLTRVVWHTLRTRPAGADEAGAGTWRVDPALACGGVLADHGWHAFYVLRRWVGEPPTSISARLETRQHGQWAVEDTATVTLAFPRATAEVLVTWAADRRRNWVELTGTAGRIELCDDTLTLARSGLERRWSVPPALSDGSYHPDWFGAVVDQFVTEVTSAMPDSSNLADASLCVALETLARESSRRGAQRLSVPASPLAAPAATMERSA